MVYLADLASSPWVLSYIKFGEFIVMVLIFYYGLFSSFIL